jgi:hypothetical protein
VLLPRWQIVSVKKGFCMKTSLKLAAAIVLAAGSAASAQSITPPNISVAGGQWAWPIATPYTQVLTGMENVNAFRLVVDALANPGGNAYQADMQMLLVSPSGITHPVGGDNILWNSFRISGTGPGTTASAQSFDGIYLADLGPIAGTWSVNFRNNWTSDTLQWTNIQIFPLELPTGACCLPVGTCAQLLEQVCLAHVGTYFGDHSICSGVPACNQPPPHHNFEVEPNNTKDDANHFVLQSGDAIVGVSTTSFGIGTPFSPDYFRIQTPPAPPGIYQHRMILTSDTVGHGAWIRALPQTGIAAGPWPCGVGSAGSADNAGQSHMTVGTDRVNIWYGFGKQEQVYYRVAGTTATTGLYVATLETTPVTPTSLGTFQAGVITITTAGQGHTSDTHLRIYDAGFNPVFGYSNNRASINGGHTANTTNVSFLRREFVPGTYYLALTIGTLATSEGNPCDDNTRTTVMADFPDAAFNVGTVTTTNVSFAITDAGGTAPFVAHRGGTREVAWFRLDVTGTITTGACCLASGACLDITASMCIAQSGAYGGDHSTCAATPCPQPGACCLPGGRCLVMLEPACTAVSGVFDGAATCAAVSCTLPLLSNGEMVTHLGLGHNGSDISRASANFDIAGSNATLIGAGPHFRIADDFTISDPGGWDLSSVVIHAYMTSTAYSIPPVSPITSANVNIWDGIPGTTGSTIVASSNTLLGTGWTGIYRVFNTAVAIGRDRPIMFVNVAFPNVHLPQGTYWIDYQMAGAIGTVTTVWTPYVMEVDRAGNPVTPLGNSRFLSDQGWGSTGEPPSTLPYAVDFPFALLGSVAGPAPCYANCDESTTPPILNVEDFSCFINAFAAASLLPPAQQLTHYANCDSSTTPPVLNVEDFSCFINAFAAGCP